MQLVPATLADLLAHLSAKNLPLDQAHYRQLVDEVLSGRVMVARGADGTPAVLGGIFQPETGGLATCWFSVVPGAVARSLAPLVLALRAFLRFATPHFAAGVAAYVADGNDRGARLARAIGFVPAGLVLGDVRQWRYGRDHGQDGQEAVRAGG